MLGIIDVHGSFPGRVVYHAGTASKVAIQDLRLVGEMGYRLRSARVYPLGYLPNRLFEG